MTPIVTRVIASQNAARTRRLLITTRTEPMTSKTLSTRNAMNSQSMAKKSRSHSRARIALHRAHLMTRKPAATRIARSE